MTNKACQVNLDGMNIETCYRCGSQALQNKKWLRKLYFLREQKDEKNFIVRVLFSLKLSNREEGNLSYRLKKMLIAKICLKVVLMMKSPSVNV